MTSCASPTKRKREATPEPGPSHACGAGLLTPPPSQKKVAVKVEADETSNSLQRISWDPQGLVTLPKAQLESSVEPQIKLEPVEANVNDVIVGNEEASNPNDTVEAPSLQAPIKQDQSDVKQEILDSLGITPEIAARAVPPNDGKFRFASGEFRGCTVNEVPIWYIKEVDKNGTVQQSPGLEEAIIEWATRLEIPSEGATLPELSMYEINNCLLAEQEAGNLDSTFELALKYHLLRRKPEEPGEKYLHLIGKEFWGCTLFEAVERRGDESYLTWMKEQTHMAVREGNEHMAEGLEYYHRKKAREIKRHNPYTYKHDYEYRYHTKHSSRWNWLMDGNRPLLLGPLMYPRTVPPVSTVTDGDRFKRKCPKCGMRAPTVREAEELENYGQIFY